MSTTAAAYAHFGDATAQPSPGAARTWCWRAFLLGPLAVMPLWLLATEPWSNAGNVLVTVNGMVLLALAGAATYTDLRWHKIPNWATYSALLWAVLLSAAATLGHRLGIPELRLSSVSLVECLVGGVGMGLLLLMLCHISGGGAGDVKFGAALGALVGFDLALHATVTGLALAGLMMLAWALVARGPWQLLSMFARQIGSFVLPLWIAPPDVEQRQTLRTPVPLAPFFAAGTLLALFREPLDVWFRGFGL